MALVEATQLTSGQSSTDDDEYNSASITFPVGQIVLIAILSQISTTAEPNDPILGGTGGGLTFEQIESIYFDDDRKVSLYVCVGNGTTRALNISFAPQTQVGCCWSIATFKNTAIDGVDGNGAVVQTITDTGSGDTLFSITMGAFSDVKNATFVCVGKNDGNNVEPDAGLTELGDVQTTTPIMNLATMWKNGNDTTPGGAFQGSGGANWAAIGIELDFQQRSGMTGASEI